MKLGASFSWSMLLLDRNMTRIDFTRNNSSKTTTKGLKIATPPTETVQDNSKHFDHHQQRRQQQKSMRRQLRWRVPSIVLLLASCLLFVVLLTLEYANCYPQLNSVGGDRKLLSHGRMSNHRATTTPKQQTSSNINHRSQHHHRHAHGSILHNSPPGQVHNDAGLAHSGGHQRRRLALVPGAQFLSDQSEAGVGGGQHSQPDASGRGSVSSISEFSMPSGEVSISIDSISSGSGGGSSSIEESNNQQVPEQGLPIVVSSRDNSYVSASPIETTTISGRSSSSSRSSGSSNSIRPNHHLHQRYHPKQHHNPSGAQTMQTMTPSDNNPRPTIGANYNIKRATIIKTRESIQMGATFINYTLVTNLNACLVECWITDNCDTAIYQESPVDFNNHLPYLINNKQINHNIISPSSANQVSPASKSLSNLLAADNGIRGASIGEDATSINDESNDDDDDDDNDDDDGEREEDVDSNENYNNIVDTFWMNSRSKIANNNNFNNNNDDDDDDDEQPQQQEDDNEFGSRQADRADDADVTDPDVNFVGSNMEAVPETGFFICYLFQCAKADGFKCQFSAHNYYVSSTGKRVGQEQQQLPRRPTQPPVSNNNYHLTERILDETDLQMDDSRPILTINSEPHYSNVINGRHHQQQNDWFSSRGRWHPSHVASIRIGQEDDYGRFDGGGLSSAIIALMIGVCATGMLIMIVGHKMKSIRKRIAYKGRRRSLVPDADFLINTMPI